MSNVQWGRRVQRARGREQARREGARKGGHAGACMARGHVHVRVPGRMREGSSVRRGGDRHGVGARARVGTRGHARRAGTCTARTRGRWRGRARCPGHVHGADEVPRAIKTDGNIIRGLC
ncbi:hypothetical protein GGX14DRAFT_384635 [Mycena pura]|uniref:Uncharacterized protein n=1 Tax=Mycena pura TaxID=153505 RepID=A0AAD7E716_9AGAR|nr:hypothetical protein GGX14DRAFT_384635 [Mycena pura]